MLAPSSGGSGGGQSGGEAASAGSTGLAATSTGGTSSGGSTGLSACSTSSTGSATGPAPSCLASAILTALGKNHFLTGFTSEDGTTQTAPFDLRYQYLSAGIPDAGVPCTKCDASCTSGGDPHAWWGCYNSPPGDFIHEQKILAGNQTLMLTYYELFQSASLKANPAHPTYDARYATFQEGVDEVVIAANDPVFMKAYFNDWRFVLQQVGSNVIMLHFEPDFWGFAEQQNLDAHALPAAVASANPSDCPCLENSIAGMGQCVIAMTRKYAPNALISLHASAWASNKDVLSNTDAGLDVAAEANKTVAFLKACGQDQADFITADLSNADADFYEVYYNDSSRTWHTDTTLPNFAQADIFTATISQGLGKPLLWWQVPVGNAGLSDAENGVCDPGPSFSGPVGGTGAGSATFKDNRVDYFFANMSELIASGVFGVAYGPGLGCDTTFNTDGGNLINKTTSYAGGGYTSVCPP